MASRLVLASLAASVALIASLTAVAARAEPGAADRETARQLMEAGRALRARNDLKGALQRFQAADEIMHVPTTGLEVARTQELAGLLVEARDTIARIRLIAAKPNDPEPFKDARIKAEQLDASLVGRLPKLIITVRGGPSGSTLDVSIDGVAVPAAVVGLPRPVDPGHHVVAVKTDGAAGQQDVDVREGERKAVDVTLAPSSTASTAQAAAPPQQAPATDRPVEETAAPTAPGKTSHGPDWLTYAGGGIAVAGLAVGTVTGVMSWSKTSSLASACPGHACPPSGYSAYDSASSLATISTVSFVVGGVGACLAVISLVVGHEDKSEPATGASAAQLRVSPWIGAGAAGLRGSF